MARRQAMRRPGPCPRAALPRARSSGHGASWVARRRCLELLVLSTAGHRAGRTLAGGDRALHGVEVARADEGLVLGGAIACALLGKLALLELGVTVHALIAVG